MPVRRKNITDHEIITACAAEFPDPIDSLFVQYKVLQKNREQWTIWACSVRKDIIETYKEAAEAQKIHVDAFYSPALLSTPTEKGYVLRVYNLEPCPPSIVLYKDGLPIDELLLPAKVTPAIIVKELKNLQKEYTEEESPIALELFTDAGTANDMKVPQKSSGKKNVMNEFLNMRLSPLCKSKAFGGSNSTYMLSALTASGSKNNLNLIIEKKSTTPTLLALAVVTTVLASIWIWYYLQA